MANLIGNAALTFKNEGSSDKKSHYYSRIAHVPGNTSGVTIGRGYDMKTKSKAKIIADLKSIGMEESVAKQLAEASGLSGDKARDFVKQPEISKIELDEGQEIELFNLTYIELKRDTRRLCEKPDVEKKFGACNWEQLSPEIKEFLVDLRYRGDYSPAVRSIMQAAVVKQDYAKILEIVKDPKHWGNLDKNRMNERIRHLESAAASTK
jgi:hypothetical protein